MNSKINTVVLIDLLFLLLLLISGSFDNKIISNVIYYSAFIIPIAIGIFAIKKTDSSSDEKSIGFAVAKEDVGFSLPLFAPTVILVLGISLLFTFIMGKLGLSSSANYDEPLLLCVVLHAVLPSMLEELLFRYIPLKLLSQHGCGYALILSSVMFAFAHASVFQILHPLVAGIIFGFITLSTKSILPAIILHLLNNTLSLILMKTNGAFRYSIIAVLLIIGIISVAVIITNKERYRTAISSVFTFTEERHTYSPLIFIGASFCIALTNLLLTN